MNLGIMLPLARPFAEEEASQIEQALRLGFTTLWLQEWPVGSGPPGQRDHGSGHDLLLYASHLAREYGAHGAQIGLAVVRAEYRSPSVTARAVVSAQVLGGGHPLLLGLGADPREMQTLVQAWQVIHSCLHAESDAFLLPRHFTPPRMFLASGKTDLWSATGYQARGLLTTRIDPRHIAAIAEPLRQHVPHLEIIVQVFWRIDLEESEALYRGPRDVLQIGRTRVRELARLWKEAGVTGIIYYPPETPSAEQLQLVAEAIGEEGL
jgi:hypothetical protein